MAPKPGDAGPSQAKSASNATRPPKRSAEGIHSEVASKKPRTNARPEPSSFKNRPLVLGQQNKKTSSPKPSQGVSSKKHTRPSHNGSAGLENGSQSHPRAAKRAKNYDNRAIATQKADFAFKDGELSIQSFVNSRVFQMKALDESMRRTRVTKTTRAFQRVPISLRRRSAAHNHKRVPKRLQKRAKREMVDDNTPTVNSRTRKPKLTRSRLRAQAAQRMAALAKRKRLRKLTKSGVRPDVITIRTARPKIRRNVLNDHDVVASKYKKRQRLKAWLPTHLWHAKRARMTSSKNPMWSYAIPLTPNDKSYRPTHRSLFSEGAVAWDMSYMNTISLNGAFCSVKNVLKDLGLVNENLWGDRGERWVSGAVHWTGMLSSKEHGESLVIAPASVLWNPTESAPVTSEPTKDFRQVFIRVHPSAFLQAFEELKRLVRMQNPRPYVEDLKHQIGSIDITGAHSTEALLSILKPYVEDESQDHHTKFVSLAGLKDAAALPGGSLLSFSIRDPRLHYPPKRAEKSGANDQKAQETLWRNIASFHKDFPLSPNPLFDRDARHIASGLPSQKSLSRRKGKGAPGVPLGLTKADPAIPIILMASRTATKQHVPGTWTVLLPLKCVLPVWYCLMHCPLSAPIERNPRFGGVDEIRQLAFERGQPWFPGDFPGTAAGNTWEISQRRERQTKWNRLPKSKRVNYDNLNLGAGRRGEIGKGWRCDYETLLGLHKTTQSQPSVSTASNGEAQCSNSQESGELLATVRYLPKSAFDAYKAPGVEPLPAASLIIARVAMVNKGTPVTCARIYRLPESAPTVAHSAQVEVPASDPPPFKAGDGQLPPNLREQWLAERPRSDSSTKHINQRGNGLAIPPGTDLETRKQLIARSLLEPPPSSTGPETINGHPLCPDEKDLIGFITTGSYNLRDGRSEGIGSLAAVKALAELRRYHGNRDDPASRLCVVRNAGESIGWLARWDLV